MFGRRCEPCSNVSPTCWASFVVMLVDLGFRLQRFAHQRIFPLPWLPKPSDQQRAIIGRCFRRDTFEHFTCLLGVCNYLHGGPLFQICRLSPSVAQKRVMERLSSLALKSSVRMDGQAVASSFIRTFPGMDFHGYGARQVTKPLGSRAGVPTAAASCDPANNQSF